MLLCIVYVSEASRAHIIQGIRSLLSNSRTAFVHSFEDITYNRTSFFLAGDDVKESALKISEYAYSNIKFQEHHGTHPTLGTVDHICFSPLGESTIESVSNYVQSFAEIYSNKHEIPVYCYGAASIQKNKLKYIRKQLGYFETVKNNTENKSTTLQPSYGQQFMDDADKNKGITCIGLVPFVLNYNMRFRVGDCRNKVIQVAKHIRSPEVECLTLPHDDNAYEVACNLLNSQVYGPQYVYEKAIKKAKELDIEIIAAYTTGPTADELLQKYKQIMRTCEHVGNTDVTSDNGVTLK